MPSSSTNILITGASSGLGAALAKAYAMPGVVLGLMGRNQERLKEVADYCTRKGAKVEVGLADVRDDEIMSDWIEHFDDRHPVDLLIANAGVSAGAGGQKESQKKLREIFAVNIDGVLNSVLPIIPRMQQRRQGHIAVMSSLAGIRGLPSCPAYSASKNAVRAFGEGLRGDLKQDGVHVSVICPGYIKTPMTDVNEFPMPFIMSAERAADIIMGGIQKNKARIAFPLALYLPLWLISCLPVALTDPLFALLPKKK
ncbi:MAG TPA: SDR family NAD(P)-dependent oxidoreductase [Rickettsiales bacterium]|nr:SDR family NAD(P)-dependent oxidoreductase [Rickettsiales bacterium]